MPEGPSTQGTDAAQRDPDPRNQPLGSSGLPPELLLPCEPGSPSPPQTCPQGPANGLGPMHSPYPHICTNIRKATLNHLSSLARDPAELGDFSPKGPGAHGTTMPIALPFGCEGTHPWGSSRVRSRRLLVLHNIPEGPSVTAATEPFTEAGRSCDSLLLPTHSAARNILRALKSRAPPPMKQSLCSQA